MLTFAWKYFQHFYFIFFLLRGMPHPNSSTPVSFISTTELFAETFAQNVTLDDSGLFHPSPPRFDYIMSYFKIVCNIVSHAFSSLDLGRHTVLMESFLLFPKTVLLCLCHTWSTFPSVCLHLFFLYTCWKFGHN